MGTSARAVPMALADDEREPRWRGAAHIIQSFDRLTTHEQAALLSLPLLLLHSDDHWYVSVPVIALAIAALVFPTLRRDHLVWLALACFTGAGALSDWSAADNHKYLLAYWSFALFLAHFSTDPGALLARSARWLVAFTFLLGTFWKVVSPDFSSGEFFQYTLQLDPRFSERLLALGLADAASVDLNRAAVRALTSYDGQLLDVPLVVTPTVMVLSRAMTWWTLAVEAAIAIAFVLPARKLEIVRHGLLLTFVATTYLLAPVLGFAWLLVVMGFVQCDRTQKRTRLFYLALLPLLQLFRLPWPVLASGMAS